MLLKLTFKGGSSSLDCSVCATSFFTLSRLTTPRPNYLFSKCSKPMNWKTSKPSFGASTPPLTPTLRRSFHIGSSDSLALCSEVGYQVGNSKAYPPGILIGSAQRLIFKETTRIPKLRKIKYRKLRTHKRFLALLRSKSTLLHKCVCK